jgi:glycosyltransferase involved in cell wall biosynthesis
MNILFVNATRTWGGIKTWMVEFGSYLARRGHVVSVACRPGNLMLGACAARGLVCHPIPFGADYSPATIARFVRLLRAERTDTIVTNISKDIRTAGIAARLCGVAHVNRLGGFGDIANDLRTRIVYDALVDRVFVPSRCLAAHFEQFPFLRGKVSRFPNAVVPISRDASTGGPPRFAVLARLSARKRVDRVLLAFARLQALPWELHIGGSGPEMPALIRMAGQLGIRDRVHFACEGASGFSMVDGPAFLRDKDVGLLVSEREPFGWAILEYMAASCAVIASAVDGSLEIIEHNVDGLLVDPSSLDDLVAAIRSLILSPELRRVLAKNGHERVCREYHQDIVFPSAEAELSRVALGHRRRVGTDS